MSKSKKGVIPYLTRLFDDDEKAAERKGSSGSSERAPPTPPQEPPPPEETSEEKKPGCCGRAGEPGCCAPGGWCLRVCCWPCFLGAKVGYVIAGGFALLTILGLVIVAVANAVAIVDWNPEASGQSVGLMLMAILETGAACIIIWGYIAIFKKGKTRHRNLKIIAGTLLGITAVLVILTLLYASSSEETLDTSLVKSFQEARLGNQKARKSWSALQGSLECCGVISPEDYRQNGNTLFAPDVPISCCSNYNSDASELAQENSRQYCKQRRLFYSVGCRQPAGELLNNFSITLLSIVSSAVGLQITLAILAWWISRQAPAKRSAENGETLAV